MEINLYCLSCHKAKHENDWCRTCDCYTLTGDVVTQPNEQFIKGLWHESDPFRYRIEIGKDTYRIEAYGEDKDGVFLTLYKDQKTVEYRPSK